MGLREDLPLEPPSTPRQPASRASTTMMGVSFHHEQSIASRQAASHASTPARSGAAIHHGQQDHSPEALFLDAFVKSSNFREDVPISVLGGAWDRLGSQTMPPPAVIVRSFRQQVMLCFFDKGMKQAKQLAQNDSSIEQHLLRFQYDLVAPLFGTIETSVQSTVKVHILFARSGPGYDPTHLHYASIQLYLDPAHVHNHLIHKISQCIRLGEAPGDEFKGLVGQLPLSAFLVSQGLIPPSLQIPLRKYMECNADHKFTLVIRATGRAGSGLEDHDNQQGHLPKLVESAYDIVRNAYEKFAQHNSPETLLDELTRVTIFEQLSNYAPNKNRPYFIAWINRYFDSK